MRHLRSVALVVASPALAFLLAACLSQAHAEEAIKFDDVRQQSLELMKYEQSIRLTPEQEAIKKEALTPLPAPCCSDNSAYTCCCPCNLSRTIWGLSNYLIAEHQYDAEKVRQKVEEWIAFINPQGFSGDVCYSAGGCGRSFEHNGCGGMRPDRITF